MRATSRDRTAGYVRRLALAHVVAAAGGCARDARGAVDASPPTTTTAALPVALIAAASGLLAWRHRRRERELRTLVEHAPDVVIRFDRALRVAYVNPAVEAYTGAPRSALRGKTVAELGFPAEHVRRWEEGLQDVARTRQPRTVELALETPAGTRHLESRLVPETTAAGELRSIIGITRDVTERRRAEDHVRRNEAFLAEGQRIGRAGTWSRSRSSGQVVWSDEHYRLFAADPTVARPWDTEALRALFWARVHPADRERLQQVFATAMRDFTPYATEFRIVRPDGTIRHLRSVGGPSGGDGAATGDDYIGTTLDVTETRRAEEELRRSEAYLAEGQRLTRTGSWAWKLATGEIYFSREMFRLYGFEPAERAPPYEAVLARAHPDDAPAVHRALQEAFRTGRELRLLTRVLVPGEPMKWVETFGHPVHDEQGTLVEFIGTVVDVTERRRAVRRRRRAIAARYEAVLAERLRIARDMHDGLLQDVTGIALQLGAVLPHVRELPDAAARLEGILALAERAGREARQALQGMRREAPAVDVAAAVQREAQRVCAPTTIVLTVRVAGQAGPVGPHVCEAVVAIVHEALTNVLKHAAARRVRVVVACTDRRLRLAVRDDGRGLTVPVHDGGGADGHFGMTGMRERASAIGATLAVTSAAGRGTAVRLDVPLARGRAALSRRGG